MVLERAVVKFNSWFRGKSVPITDKTHSDENVEISVTDQSIPESDSVDNVSSEDDNTSSNKSKKSALLKVGAVYSAVVSKLPGHPKPLYKRVWFWSWVTFGGTAGLISYGIWTIDRGLPQTSELNSIAREQTMTIKAVDGSILKQSGPATRDRVTISQIPEQLRQAFIASEDRRFKQHDGVDYQGIVRAVVNNLRSQNVVEGGSTITQQLSRILFLSQEKTVLRKAREIRLAQKMEKELGKDEILERYLNLVYLGAGAYGVADAAWVYFSKSLDQLTLGEMAMIAGLAPAPSVFAPDRNPEAAKLRRNLVLQRMLEDGVITQAQKDAATSEQLTINPSPPKRTQVNAPYFTSYIEKELPKLISQDKIAAGGLTIETTLDLKKQEYAENAVAKTLRNQGRYERFRQAALVSLDPRTGEIKAMVGGSDFGKHQFNRVTQAQRQPGSTFKAFVYAAAIASGQSPYDTYNDAPYIIDGYEPKNFDEGYRGTMDIRNALTKSVNIIAVKALVKTGYNPVIKIAKDMGIKSNLKETYSLALGSNEVNLLELTNAYGSFANEGLHVEAHGISKIMDRQGKVLWQSSYQPQRALDSDSSAIMTWMLRNVVTSGTGSPASLGRRPVAGKTGTTDDARDLWFVGYIPQLVTGVWLGNDNNRPTYGSSATAAYTWHEFMENAVEGMPIEKFPSLPENLDKRKASIKAEPIKPRRVVNRSIPSRDEVSRDDDAETPRRRRRRSSDDSSNNFSSDNNEGRSSRRRRSFQGSEDSSTNEGTPRRRRRLRVRENNSESTNNSSSDSTSSRSRRRRRSNSGSSGAGDSNPSRRRSAPESSGGRSSGNSGSSGNSEGNPSWRERLRPGGE